MAIYTATDCVERVSKIISGDYPTAAMEARIWLFMKDIYSQLTDRLYNCWKTSSSMSVGSSTQTVDMFAEYMKPLQVYCITSPGGVRVNIKLVGDLEWGRCMSTTTTATYPSICRIFGSDSDKNKQLQISPMFSSASTLYVDYIRYPTELSEYTTGTATIHKGSSTAIGATTVQWDSFVTARNSYFRVDSVGKWYQITSIPTTSTITISPSYITATQSSKAYTISNAIELPEQGCIALIYGTAAQMLQVSGQKEMAGNYYQLYQDAVTRLTASETNDSETMRNCYTSNS